MTSRTRVLVVEDDVKVARTVGLYLERAGFEPVLVADGADAVARALRERFGLVVLDVMLPGLDGLTVCRRIREVSDVPVILLTARTEEADRVRGLDLGADDYVPKPFSPRELMARVRAVLRRAGDGDGEGEGALHFRGLSIDLGRRSVVRDGRPVALTATQFDLLATLARRPGRVFRRDEIVERALGGDAEVGERTVDAHVKNLRRRLGEDPARPRFVETVLGVGYRFRDPPDAGPGG